MPEYHTPLSAVMGVDDVVHCGQEDARATWIASLLPAWERGQERTRSLALPAAWDIRQQRGASPGTSPPAMPGHSVCAIYTHDRRASEQDHRGDEGR